MTTGYQFFSDTNKNECITMLLIVLNWIRHYSWGSSNKGNHKRLTVHQHTNHLGTAHERQES